MANYKKEKFYITDSNRKGEIRVKEVEGEILDIKGIRFGIHKNKNKKYTATELTTGMAVTIGEKTRKETLEKIESVIDRLPELLKNPKLDSAKEAIRNAKNPAPEVKAVANEPAKETPVKADAPEEKVTKKAATKKEEKMEEKTMTAAKEVRVEMGVNKVTKNMVRFEEITESEFVSPKIGTQYVPKGTLGELGYEEGDGLEVVIRVIKKAK